MKSFFTNLFLFAALSVVLSGFTACTNNTTNSSNASGDTQNNEYPPAPAGILQSEIKDLEGNSFKIEDKKGKVVLINLWATWCGPCRAEMPDLIEMQDKYRDKNFEVVGLNTDDETLEEIKAFAEKMKLNYQLGYADGELLGEFVKITRMNGIPQSILINRDGRMTGVFAGGGKRVIGEIKETVDKTVNE